MWRQPQVISLGSINADFQARVEQWPVAGKDIMSSQFLFLGGGRGANVAYAARRLGVPSMLVGRIGDDVLAEQALRGLRDLDVDLRFTFSGCREATGVGMIVVNAEGKKTIIAAANANEMWSRGEADLAASAIAESPADSILVVDCAIPFNVVEMAAQVARGRQFSVVLDPSPPKRVGGDLYRVTDFITPNETEAKELTGITLQSLEDAVQAGRVLIRRGTKAAFMKLDNGGCIVVTADSAIPIRPIPVEVVDTTGAGDAFAGSLAVALLEGRDPLQAGRFAVAAAHVAVTRYGAQPSYPCATELEQMLARLPE